MNKKLVGFVAAFAVAAFGLSIASVARPATAFAANTYTRSPAGAFVDNPVSFHYDYTSWYSDVLPTFYGSGSDFRYLLLHVTNGTDQYDSPVIPCVDPTGADYYCPGTDSSPKSIDFTATLATTSPASYVARICGSRSSTVDTNGYFTDTSSCITWDGFKSSPIDMLRDSFRADVPDVTPPTVAITAPADGSAVSGSVAIVATASDDRAVVGVQFQVDGINRGFEVANAPYTIPWDASSSGDGVHALTAIARDAAGNIASTSMHVTVFHPVLQKYVFGGFLVPVKADGSGVYKQGKTLPVKFQLADVDGGTSSGVSAGRFDGNASATLSLSKISDGVAGTQEVALSTSVADTANQFRYDAASNQYIYNLATAALSPGTWQLQVQLDDERKYTVKVTIR